MYDWKDVTTLAPGAGSGNVTTPVLGQTQNADAIVGTQNNKINTPVTNAWVTASLFGRLRFIGNYVKADGSNETSYVEADAGKFVSFEIARFFAGLGETVSSRSRTDYWSSLGARRGDARPERRPRRRLGREQAASWTGRPSSRRLFLDTVTYAGQSTGDLLREINARTRDRRHDPRLRRARDGAIARPLLRQRRLVPDPAERRRDARRRRDRRARRPGRPLRPARQHLRRGRIVFAVGPDAHGGLPPRRRPTPRSSGPTTSTGTATTSAASGTSRTS